MGSYWAKVTNTQINRRRAMSAVGGGSLAAALFAVLPLPFARGFLAANLPVTAPLPAAPSAAAAAGARAAWTHGAADFTGAEGGPPERVVYANVAASFFRVLDVPPRIGRTWSAEEADEGCFLVLSEEFWRDRLSGLRRVLDSQRRYLAGGDKGSSAQVLDRLRGEPGPKFVMAHILLPHPPYVYDSDGRPMTEEEAAKAARTYTGGCTGIWYGCSRVTAEGWTYEVCGSSLYAFMTFDGAYGNLVGYGIGWCLF